MPQGKDALRQNSSSSTAAGSSGDNSFIGPEQRYDVFQGIAEGGKSLGNDLPVRATSGGSNWREGFAPTDENPPLPDPWSVHEGVGKPPGGGRR